jgi:hypothetical protein
MLPRAGLCRHLCKEEEKTCQVVRAGLTVLRNWGRIRDASWAVRAVESAVSLAHWLVALRNEKMVKVERHDRQGH